MHSFSSIHPNNLSIRTVNPCVLTVNFRFCTINLSILTVNPRFADVNLRFCTVNLQIAYVNSRIVTVNLRFAAVNLRILSINLRILTFYPPGSAILLTVHATIVPADSDFRHARYPIVASPRYTKYRKAV